MRAVRLDANGTQWHEEGRRFQFSENERALQARILPFAESQAFRLGCRNEPYRLKISELGHQSAFAQRFHCNDVICDLAEITMPS